MKHHNNKTDVFTLNNAYSTTRRVTFKKPYIFEQVADGFNSSRNKKPLEKRKKEGGLRTNGYYKINNKEKPLITIITVAYNAGKKIQQTINSVTSQTYDNIEHVIIDGGSSDNTRDIIKDNEQHIDYWLSEKDKGIYDAMNKGISLSSGEFICFLNADDWMESNACLEAITNIKDEYDFLAGAVDVIDEKKQTVFKSIPMRTSQIIIPGLQEMPFPHQGLFVRRKVFEKIGLFDLNYKIVADMEFVCRMLYAGFTGITSSSVVTNFRAGGASSDNKRIKEERKVAIKYGKPKWAATYKMLITYLKKGISENLPPSLVMLLCRIVGSRHFVSK